MIKVNLSYKMKNIKFYQIPLKFNNPFKILENLVI